MPPLVPIPAPDRAVPRYCSGRALPAYRHVPGLHPHPTRDPAGHSYEPLAQLHRHPAWDAADWRTLTDWLWGVDLFNAFYFWEAHEAWEGLWAAQARGTAAALLLQGLIQVAAALLKTHVRSLAGATSLSREGLEKIARAAGVSPAMLGLELNRVRIDFTNYFRPLAQRTLPPLDASVPLLTLSGDREQ